MYNEFLRIAKLLNDSFEIKPVLFGSLGLGKILNMNFDPQDIDLLIPKEFIENRWNELKQIIENIGYSLVDLHEHEFSNSKYRIAFAEIEGLKNDLHIELNNIEIIHDSGIYYKILNIQQFLLAYEYSFKDGYRREKLNNKDFFKIQCIKGAIAKI